MGKIRIDLDASLTANTNYYVLVDEGFAVDANTGEPSPAITDQNAVTFTALPAYTDIENVPEDDLSDFVGGITSKTKRLDITFEQDVFKGASGTINLYTAGNSLIESFDITTDVYFRFSPPGSENTTGTKITIYATDWFENTSPSYVIISDEAIRDANCMTIRETDSRTSSDVTLDFNYQSATDIPSMTPESYFTIQYCEDVTKLTGNVYLYDSGDTLIETINVSGATVINGNQLKVTPKYELQEETDYYVTSDRGVVGDTHGFSYGPIVKNDTGVDVVFYKPYALHEHIIQFNRDVRRGVGKVYLKKQVSDELVKEWDIQWDADWIGVNGLTADDIITLDDNRATLKANLAQGGAYYFLIDDGAFTDLDKVPFAGYASVADWDFFVYNGPEVDDVIHRIEKVDVKVGLRFPVGIYHETSGQLYVHRDSDDSLITTIEHPSETLIEGTTLFFDPGVFNTGGTDYYVLAEKELVTNNKNYQFRGVTDKTEVVFTSASCIYATAPVDNSTAQDFDSFSITFDRDLTVGTGNISLYDYDTDTLINAWDVTSDITISSATIGAETFDSKVTLDTAGIILQPSTQYYVLVDSGAFTDVNSVSFEGVATKTIINWTTFAGPDIISTTPVIGSIDNRSFDVSMTFDVDILTQPGNIYLKKYSDDSTVETFDTTTNITIVDDTISFSVTENLLSDTKYYITVDADVIYDSKQVYAEVLQSKDDFYFTTDTVSVILQTPIDNETNVELLDMSIQFENNVSAVTGDITLYEAVGDVLVDTWDITSLTITDDTVYIPNSETLDNNTVYYVLIDGGSIVDEDGILFDGFALNNQWNFTTGGAIISTSTPLDNSTNIRSRSFEITLDENITANTGDIKLYKASGDVLVDTWDVTTDVSIVDNVITFSTSELLAGSTDYYFTVDQDSLIDSNNLYYVGFTDNATLNFTTGNTLISATQPADNLTDTDLIPFSITFDRNITAVTGNIELYETIGDVLVDTWDITNETIVNDTLTIDASDTDLSPVTDYYVNIDAGAFNDSDGITYAGLTSTTGWNFTTKDDAIITNTSPTDNDTDVRQSTFSVTYSKNITAETGDFYLRKTSDDSLIETIDVTTGSIVDDTITFTLTENLEPLTEYYILSDNEALKDADGILIDGIVSTTAFSFTTGEIVITLTTPLDDATNAADVDIYMEFDRNITANVGNIYIYEKIGDVLIGTYDVTTDVTFNNNTLTIDSSLVPVVDTEYYVKTDADIFYDTDNLYFKGISDESTFNFTIGEITVLTLTPADSEPLADASLIKVHYDRNVNANTGTYRLYKTTGDVLIQTWDVTSDVTIVGDTVTLDNVSQLDPSTDYYILFDYGVVEDLYGVPCVGLTVNTDWNFTTLATSVVTASEPVDASTNQQFTDVWFQYDRDITANTGDITMYRWSDDAVIQTWDVTSDVTIVGDTVTLDNLPTVEELTEYYFIIDDDAFIDVYNVLVDGYTVKANTFTFTTIDDAEATSFDPLDNAISQNWNDLTSEYSFTFNRQVTVNTGNFYLKKVSDQSTIKTWAIGDLDFDSVDTFSFIIIEDDYTLMLSNTEYYFELDADVVSDSVNSDFGSKAISGTSAWSFTTGTDVSNTVDIVVDTFVSSSVTVEFTGSLSIAWNGTDYTDYTDSVSPKTAISTGTMRIKRNKSGGSDLSTLKFYNNGDITDISVTKSKDLVTLEIGVITNCDTITLNGMFNLEEFLIYSCNNLTSVSVADMGSLQHFQVNSSSVSTLTGFEGINGNTLVSMKDAFNGCSSITIFPLITTTNVTDWSEAFKGCSGMTAATAYDTSAGTDFSNAWSSCVGLTSFPLLDFSSAITLYQTWAFCSGLTSFPSIDFSNAETFTQTWSSCSSLTSFPAIDCSGATNVMYGTWQGCTLLTAFTGIIIGNNVTYINETWANCINLATFPNIHFNNVTSVSAPWYGCSSLGSFGTINSTSIIHFSYMFKNCTNLTHLPFMDTSNGETFREMFYGCSSLGCLTNLNTLSETTTDDMFYGCSSLTAPTSGEQTSLLSGYNYTNAGSCP